jgi:hypothetical protein
MAKQEGTSNEIRTCHAKLSRSRDHGPLSLVASAGGVLMFLIATWWIHRHTSAIGLRNGGDSESAALNFSG